MKGKTSATGLEFDSLYLRTYAALIPLRLKTNEPNK